jgi:uncharacterized protein (TIGR02466 family)|tara:strand:+ start:194 stop:871 length:678 start_codon:yes stop_codon:yes gene_type:complete
MSTSLEFNAVRPFGPTILHGKLPEDLIKMLDDRATELFEDEKLSKKFDHSMHLAGNVKQEVRYPFEDLNSEKFKPFVDAIGLIVKHYISMPPACDTISPEFVGSMVIESMWAVSQWSGDFNPFHIHQGELSGVIYLRVPPSLKEEYAREDHYPCVGDIVWHNGQAATFSGHNYQVTPEVGAIYLFPAWLSHGVYPFRTQNEERRSVSFNLHLKRRDGRRLNHYKD